MKKPTQQEYENLLQAIKQAPQKVVQKARDCGGCRHRREVMAQGLHKLSRWLSPGGE